MLHCWCYTEEDKDLNKDSEAARGVRIVQQLLYYKLNFSISFVSYIFYFSSLRYNIGLLGKFHLNLRGNNKYGAIGERHKFP